MLENIILGFSILLTFENMAALFMGTILGYFVGAMPGISSTIGIALLIPFTFALNPLPAIIFLIAIYKASYYGDSIPATLINTPGGPGAAATALDGFPLAKAGKAKKALSMGIWASGISAIASSLMLMFFALHIAAVALAFGPPEYTILALMGLSVIAGLSQANLIKGIVIACVGLFLTVIGMDPIGGGFRYVTNFYFLEGLPFVPAMIGLFAVSEIFYIISAETNQKPIEKVDGEGVSLQEIKDCRSAITKSTLLGFFVGLVPAVGANVITWIAYNEAKRSSKTPEMFGYGSLEGIAAADASGNASCNGALVPTLTLGIPGSSPLAVLLGALMLHGITPGPLLFERSPEVPFTIFAAALMAAPVMVAVGLLGMRVIVLVTLIPKNVLGPMILGLCTIGAFTITGSMFGVWVTYIFGGVGYILRRLNIPIPPMVLALVLGNMIESNYRRSLLLGDGNMIFLTRPITLVLIVLTLAMFFGPLIQQHLKTKKENAAKA